MRIRATRFLLAATTVLGLALTASIAGCGGDESSVAAGLVPTPAGELTRADVTRSDPSARSIAAVIEATNGFGTEVLRELTAGSEENLLFSPFGLSQVLAMGYAGAAGRTAGEIEATLGLEALPAGSVHRALGAVGASIDGGPQGPPSEADEAASVASANDLWSESSYGVEPEFLDILSRDYAAGVWGAEFIADPEGSRELINDHVADETEGRITDAVPAGMIDELTRLILTSSIHFEALWDQQFESAGERPFHLLDGSTRTVRAMRRTGGVGIAELADVTLIDIAYRGGRAEELSGGEYSMLLIVPDRGAYERVQAQVDAASLDAGIAELHEAGNVRLELPPFEIRAELELKPGLRALGINDAFDENRADFTPINPDARRHRIHIAEVLQDAYIRVDELGTEAAAATAGHFKAESTPEEIVVDRPFLFAIRNRESGAILFLGQVVDPEVQPPPAGG